MSKKKRRDGGGKQERRQRRQERRAERRQGGGSNAAQQPSGGGTGTDTPVLDLAAERGELAAKSARLELTEGQELYGEGTWETGGANQGDMVDEYQESNGAAGSSDYAWCGMFVGHNFVKAGIRSEIVRNLVFWSGYRLHEFLESGSYVGTSQAQAGDWWTNHKTAALPAEDEARKTALDGFGPQAGDIALFRPDHSHVGMVTSYDAATGNMELIEGNRGNKVQATAYGTGDDQITYIGRFNDTDYGDAVDADVQNAEDVDVDHGAASGGIT